MKHLKIFRPAILIMVIAFAASMASCGGGKKLKDLRHSNVTGWKHNDKKNGGFQVVYNYKQPTPPGMAFVQGGTFTMGRVFEDVIGDWNNIPRRVTVASFFMDEHEICNLYWREYLHWMGIVFHNNPEFIERAYPDTLVWREELAYNEPYLDYYFSHVAYNYYPVVGVSWEQASDYCVWRTDRVNEDILVKKGIVKFGDFQSIKGISDPEQTKDIADNYVFNVSKYLAKEDYAPPAGKKPQKDVYGNARKTNYSDGHLTAKFRLPTEAEWEYAAYGTKTINGEENYKEKKVYPWYGHQMRNPGKKFRGEMQANYVRGRGDMMGMGGTLNDHAMITAPVDAYWPNEFGLYNMAGNVNEWVMDVYRVLTSDDVQEYNPFRGNEYVSPIITESTVDGRSLRLPQIDSLGRVEFTIAANKQTEPGKYAKLDVRNYLDGDPASSVTQIKATWKEAIDTDLATKKLYDPDTDAEGLLTSKISNTTRVYKGGSWKDRAYWLNPGQRRYLEQKMSRSDIGFRCAMSKVGSEYDKTEYK